MTAYGGNEINAYGELNLKHLTQIVPGFNFWLDRGNQWLIIYSTSVELTHEISCSLLLSHYRHFKLCKVERGFMLDCSMRVTDHHTATDQCQKLLFILGCGWVNLFHCFKF